MSKQDREKPKLWFKLDKDNIRLQLKSIGQKFIKRKNRGRRISILILVFLLIGLGIAIYNNDTNIIENNNGKTNITIEPVVPENNRKDVKGENKESIQETMQGENFKLNYEPLEEQERPANISNNNSQVEGVVTEPVKPIEKDRVEKAFTLLKPVSGKIIQGPGWYYHPVFDDWRYQHGIEFEGDSGDIVMAATSGKVVSVTEDEYKGILVTIEHSGGWITQYGHLLKATVSPGEKVGKGQEIGRLGSTGMDNKTTLYFSLRNSSGPIDPTEYFNN